MSIISSGINPFGQVYNALSPTLLDRAALSRKGDSRYPIHLEKFQLSRLEKMGIVPLTQLGETKLIPMAEFNTKRRARIHLNRLYYNNEPPTPQLDLEDPRREMMRIFPAIARKVVNKGAKFLFSNERFSGYQSFIFPTANAQWKDNIWPTFWRQNKLDSKLKRVARATLWAGDDFFKFQSDIEIRNTISIPADLENQEITIKEKINTNSKVVMAEPDHFHAISDPDDSSDVLVWIYQFMRNDGTFYREEIFKDMTLQYEGRVREDLTIENKDTIKIEGAGYGLNTAQVTTKSEFIEFELSGIVDYPDFDDFPLVIFRNEPEDEWYGKSVYHGLYGKFDALIDTFTRTHNANQNQATPLLWAAGIRDNNQTEQDVHLPDAMWCFENEKATLNVLQWDGTPEAVFKFVDLLKDEIHQAVGVPKSEDMRAFTNVSAEALDRINGDIVDTTWDRRSQFEESFRDLARLVRKANGITKPIEDEMNVIWGPVFPESKDKVKEHLLALFNAGIVRAEYVVERDPLIPFHEKEELKKVAAELEAKREKLKEEAIAAQSARQNQRTGGVGNKERGAKAPKKGEIK